VLNFTMLYVVFFRGQPVCYRIERQYTYICFSQTQQYFIVQLTGDKFPYLDHRQAIFT